MMQYNFLFVHDSTTFLFLNVWRPFASQDFLNFFRNIDIVWFITCQTNLIHIYFYYFQKNAHLFSYSWVPNLLLWDVIHRFCFQYSNIESKKDVRSEWFHIYLHIIWHWYPCLGQLSDMHDYQYSNAFQDYWHEQISSCKEG